MSSEYLSNRLIDTINSEKMHVGMENDDLYKEELKVRVSFCNYLLDRRTREIINRRRTSNTE